MNLLTRINQERFKPEILPPYAKSADGWAKKWRIGATSAKQNLYAGIASGLVRIGKARLKSSTGRIVRMPIYIDVAEEKKAYDTKKSSLLLKKKMVSCRK